MNQPLYFDSHAHYWDARFETEGGGAAPLLDSLFADTLAGVVNVATSPQTIRQTVSQAGRYPRMYTALGIHPNDCQSLAEPLPAVLSRLKSHLQDPASKAVAVGEIGLDYHYDDTDKPMQQAYLAAQLELALELDLPVVIHARDAHGDIFDMVTAYPALTGVFHSYSGSLEQAKELVRRGWYISFSGTLTFHNAKKVAAVAAALPHDRVLIETDCPYLTPHPHRGKLNHSGYLSYINEALASLWHLSPADTAALTTQNAHRLFRIKP